MVRFIDDPGAADAAALRATRGEHTVLFGEDEAGPALRAATPFLTWSDVDGSAAVPYGEFLDAFGRHLRIESEAACAAADGCAGIRGRDGPGRALGYVISGWHALPGQCASEERLRKTQQLGRGAAEGAGHASLVMSLSSLAGRGVLPSVQLSLR